MINEWKKVANAIIIFDTFDWGVCSVSLPSCTSCFVDETSFSFATEMLIQIMKLCIVICTYMPWKRKTRFRSSWWAFTKTQDSDERRIDKGLMYPNTYCSITATKIKLNLSSTAWHNTWWSIGCGLTFEFWLDRLENI